MYTENYRTLLKEIKEVVNKWKDNLCSLNGRLNIVKMATLPKVIYRFNAISINIPMIIFAGMGKLVLKLIWNCKGLLKHKKYIDIYTYFKRTELKDSHIPISKLATKLQ